MQSWFSGSVPYLSRYLHQPRKTSIWDAAKSALHKAGQVVLEGHIKHCVRDGIEHGDADKTIESFTKAVERFANMK